MAVPEIVPKSVLGWWLGRRAVVIPCTNRINSSSWRVRGAINLIICSSTASWVKAKIPDTYPSTFCAAFTVGFCWKLPISLIPRLICVLYILPFLSSLYFAESSIQVSTLVFNDEFSCYLDVYKSRYFKVYKSM